MKIHTLEERQRKNWTRERQTPRNQKPRRQIPRIQAMGRRMIIWSQIQEIQPKTSRNTPSRSRRIIPKKMGTIQKIQEREQRNPKSTRNPKPTRNRNLTAAGKKLHRVRDRKSTRLNS